MLQYKGGEGGYTWWSPRIKLICFKYVIKKIDIPNVNGVYIDIHVD